MIVVFVVDTSPSMKKPLMVEGGSSQRRSAGSGMSRLDLAKMIVEDLTKGLNRRVNEHNSRLQQQTPLQQKASRNLGLGFIPNDEFLLLSTGRQHTQQPATAACGAGGRLLVGYGTDHLDHAMDHPNEQPSSHHSNVDSFQRELKKLQATEWDPNSEPKQSNAKGPNHHHGFPDDGGGAKGLNIALSSGLQLLSRYRLSYRSTENFGMGRLPSPAILNPSGGQAANALQPACLVLITDGVCLRVPPSEGGGSLQLQYGNMPLKEFYQEPFRWDQRIFCLGVGAKEGVTSSQYLHPHLRALCEVTGGSHLLLQSPGSLSQITDLLLDLIAPPLPRDLPLQDPLCTQSDHSPIVGSNGTFVAGGPVCCFQAMEADIDGGQPPKTRAMLLYVPHIESSSSSSAKDRESFQSPIWCIPESFFPSKKLDTLPPRPAQPNLFFSRYPQGLGSKSFDPAALMKTLSKLDRLTTMNRAVPVGTGTSSVTPQVKLLHRDVYICEWVSLDGEQGKPPSSPDGNEYFPVLVHGAGRVSLSEGEANYLNIGILHIPSGASTLASSLPTGVRVSTLTLLPPEPHIILPLLVKAAEAEHRAQKKGGIAEAKEAVVAGKTGATAALLQKQTASSRNVVLDDQWRTEFRAYLFRMPPYYQNALKRSLRAVLPASAHSLLNADATEGSLPSQCFSKLCLQKIRTAEQAARESVERLERQESELRRRGNQFYEHEANEQQQRQAGMKQPSPKPYPVVGYGQYDPRSSTESYLAALRNMPPPWRVGVAGKSKVERAEETPSTDSTGKSITQPKKATGHLSALDALGDLPANCLMAYYESRRRWIFGGPSFSTRGVFVEGVSNDGSNSQKCSAKPDPMERSLLSVAGVGVSSLNEVSTTKMGEYRERLLWSRAPVVGVGSNDSAGVAATTSQNGAPKWSVDDDAMPGKFVLPSKSLPSRRPCIHYLPDYLSCNSSGIL